MVAKDNSGNGESVAQDGRLVMAKDCIVYLENWHRMTGAI
jgi:hypothetical protein